jgi:nucleoside-diphosphate-sugar epimerase
MKVLVTGATGFIGAWVARALIESGHSVRATERTGSSRHRLEGMADRIEWVTADVFDDPRVDRRALCTGIDLCVHAAWYAVPGRYLEASENVSCLTGTLALFDAAAEAGVPRVAFVGTCFEYDFEYGYLSETTPTRPASLYAAAKTSTRLLCEQMARQRGVSFTWVRPFYQYGPFEDPRRLVPHVIDTLLAGGEAAITRGTQVRDFLHVAEAVNIGSGQPDTVREIVHTIGELIGGPVRIKFGARPDNPTDPPFICANTQKLLAGTTWAPRFDLRSGIADTIAHRRLVAARG